MKIRLVLLDIEHLVLPMMTGGLLFRIQLQFLVSHEYTHHVHRHLEERPGGSMGVWTEFLDETIRGSLDFQAKELEADGFGLYLVLANLLLEEPRHATLSLLGRSDMSASDADELLLRCFFLAVFGLVHSVFRESEPLRPVYQLTHPPPQIRIRYLIVLARKWCGENGSLPPEWFTPAQFQPLLRVASEGMGEGARKAWEARILALRGTEGVQYDSLLFERFEVTRRKLDTSAEGNLHFVES